MSDRLRIGMLCPYSLSVPGGVQAQALGLARELRRQGHEVRVLGPCDGPPPEPFVTPLGNSLPTAANGSIAPLAPDASATLRVVRALRDEEFDVLHLHEPFAPGVTLSTVMMHPVPMVGTFHAAGRSSSYRWFRPVLERLMDRIDRKVVVSTEARKLLDEHFPGQRYEVLFNGVDTASIRSVRPTPTSGPAVFFLGRHEERKGLDVLLAALDGLPRDVRCWVAGHGPDTQRLMQRTAGDDRVEWLGRISEAEKNARLQGASVFCAPSLHGESFGVVLIEAMAAGTPVVASGLDGYRQVATDGVDALLVPPGDVGALTEALRRVLDDHELGRRLVAAGAARADEFAMATLADRYVAIYRSLCRT